MTVKELIAELKCYEEDKEVFFDDAGRYYIIGEVDLDEDVDCIVIK